MESVDKQLVKLDKLKKQAMDFSVRNSLLSHRSDTLRLFFEFPVALFLHGDCDDFQLDQLLHQNLYAQGMEESELENIFGRMRINDRDIKKEHGRGNLYLTLGGLSWRRDGEEKDHLAPLYLCPLEIRKNKRGEHICTAELTGTRFNPVLKEFLLQEYDIDIRELKDEPANEYEQDMVNLRYYIGKKQEWKVVEDKASIGFYNIPNEAIWNGLSDSGLRNHDIVNGLLDGRMTWEKEVRERKIPMNETGVYVFQADSSQTAVIDSVGSLKAQAVIGPAGNGKTQTIGNIVGEYINSGRNVLFVTEKISAAEVLKENLESVGFGPFCLELISSKNDTKNIMNQIKDSLHFMEEYEDTYEEDSYVLKKYQEYQLKIEAFYRAMREKGSCGKSIEELIHIHEKYKDIPSAIKWDKAKGAMNHPDAEDLVAAFAETVKYSGKKQNKYTEYLKDHFMTEQEKQEAFEMIDEVIRAMDDLQDAMAQLEKNLSYRFDNCTEKMRVKKIVAYSSNMQLCPQIGEKLDILLKEEESEKKEPMNNLLKYVAEMKGSDSRSGCYKGARKRLDAELKGILKAGERMKLMNHSTPSEIEEYIISNHLYLIEKGGSYDREEEEKQKSMLRGYKRCLSKLADEGGDREVLEQAFYKIGSGNGQALVEAADRVVEKYRVYAGIQAKAEQLVVSNKEAFVREHPDEMMVQLFQQWKQNRNTEKRRKGYEAIYRRGAEAGLKSILDQLEEQVEAEDMPGAFKKAWCEYNISEMKKQIPEIESFDSNLYKIDIMRFQEYEKRFRDSIRERVIHNQMLRLPKVEEGAPDMPELGALNRLIRMNKKAVSIRNIFEQAPNLLFKMYPCMIMDPSAAAEYLPKSFPIFDMVIIDEGSQMPAYKAMIPISRGDQCMIFGDEHQMTPTSFFKRQFEDEEGDYTSVESILEEAIGSSMPKKILKYHYRSEHESLIAFSNDKYYRNEIVTFPACDTSVKGIKYVFVKDGCYARGGKKTNQAEALQVIEEVKKIHEELSEDADETVGIVTLNLAQKRLIENLLLKACAEDESIAKYIDKMVSVVNLEACQGKEWSHVIISPAYGPDEEGRLTVNLGPIGREDGANRLNVLITRAKKKMYIVTSLQPEMLGKSSVSGTKDFRDFLSYARGSIQYDTRVKELSKESNSLIRSVAEVIQKMGYEVHTNIGASKCKVDIGVVSNENPGTYIMGILLDHFTESGISVKDTEVIRSEILKKKGWNVYRVHTLNWYEDAEYETGLIKAELEKLEGVSNGR